LFSSKLKFDTSLTFFLITVTQRDDVSTMLFIHKSVEFRISREFNDAGNQGIICQFSKSFVTASHWTISPASLIHSTLSHTISVTPSILTATMPIIYLLTSSISARSGMKTRQRNPAISAVVTSV